jgi:C4-dicarboxylate-specific signal transduction histidine kinase
VSERYIQTSLIRPLGEAAHDTALDAAPILNLVLAVGECPPGAEATLMKWGAKVKTARDGVEAIALLRQESFAFMLVEAAVPDVDVSDLVCRVRLDPMHARMPILHVTPAGGAELLSGSRSPPEVLEGQLTLLLELQHVRMCAVELSEQLEDSRRDLKKTSEANAALADQARCALTELSTAQAQLVQAAKLAALGELVAGVAHEINNPLSFSLSHVSTLRRGLSQSLASLGELAPGTLAESKRLEERLAGVTFGLDRIKSLVVKLQTFSRLEDGKSQAVDVADAVGTVLTILHHRMKSGMVVTTEFGKPDTIHCDPSLINQCVMNLVVNAIDAIDGSDGEGNIHISARAEGDSYVLRVVDSGLGVPAEIHDKLFEPFFTTKPVGKGTGLGLSIASAVVKKHEGSLTLTPAAQGGTEAVIRIPLSRVTLSRRR